MNKKGKKFLKKKASKKTGKGHKKQAKTSTKNRFESYALGVSPLLTQEFIAEVFSAMDPQLTNQQKGYVRKGLNAIIFAIACAREGIPDSSGATEGLIAAFAELDDDIEKMNLSTLHLIMINPAALALVRKRSGCFGETIQDKVNEFYRAALLKTLAL